MLTDLQCKNATCPPDKKRARLADSNGLYLEVSPAGSKRWFWKYYLGTTEKRMALGAYPEVTLIGARAARKAAKDTKTAGADPVAQRKAARQLLQVAETETLAAVANDWFETKRPGWSESHAVRERRNLDKDLLPLLGGLRMAAITGPQLLAVLRTVERRSVEVAHRVLTTARPVWRFALATGRVEADVTQGLRDALKNRQVQHLAAITEPAALGHLLRAVDLYKGGPVVSAALRLAPLLFQRPGELTCASWAEFDLDAALWTIPAARMKRSVEGKANGAPHLVPLPTQAVAVLRDLQALTGGGELVFPGQRRGKPISDNTLRAALQTLGYGPDTQSVHGFRATARTLLAEVLEFDPLVIEAQLAHAVKDANGRAYNRTQYLKQRASMMQAWANYLDTLREGGRVLPLKRPKQTG